jgi:hypothetical protein
VVKLTRDEFAKDSQGRTFADVINGSAKALKELLELVSEPGSQERMEIAEEHFGRPALAGVVHELEHLPAVTKVLQGDIGTARRFRQATGAAIRIVMEGRGWRKTGRKAAVGVGTHFTRAERYERQSASARKAVG